MELTPPPEPEPPPLEPEPLLEPEPEPQSEPEPEREASEDDGASSDSSELEPWDDEDCASTLCCTFLLTLVPTTLVLAEISGASSCLGVGQSTQLLKLHEGRQVPQCCEGLTEVGAIQPGCGRGADACGVCADWRPLHRGSIGCISCGDGLCGAGESWCSCAPCSSRGPYLSRMLWVSRGVRSGWQ